MCSWDMSSLTNALTVFDLTDNSFHQIVRHPRPPPRAGHACAAFGKQMIVLIGMLTTHVNLTKREYGIY